MSVDLHATGQKSCQRVIEQVLVDLDTFIVLLVNELSDQFIGSSDGGSSLAKGLPSLSVEATESTVL